MTVKVLQPHPCRRVALWDDKLEGLQGLFEPRHSTFLGDHILHLKTWPKSARQCFGQSSQWVTTQKHVFF